MVKLYGSVNGQSKEIKKLYASVNGQSVEIKKLYGSVNGQSKLIYEAVAAVPTIEITTAGHNMTTPYTDAIGTITFNGYTLTQLEGTNRSGGSMYTLDPSLYPISGQTITILFSSNKTLQRGVISPFVATFTKGQDTYQVTFNPFQVGTY